MKKHIFTISILLTLSLLGCGDKPEEAESGSEKVIRTTRVRLQTVEALPFEKKIRVVGAVRAKREVTVSADEGGLIKSLFFDKGDKVKKGALLALLDDSTLRASLAEAKAALNMEELNYNRLASLKEKGGAVSDFDLNKSRFKKEAAEARLDIFESRLAKMNIISPLHGIVDKKMVEEGELLRPGAVLAKITDIDPVKIQTGIAESVIRFIHPGTRVTISFDAFPGETVTGQVDYIAASANADEGVFDVEIPVDNKSGKLRPGMMARITVVTERCEACMLIPRDAIVDTEVGPVVFTVNNKGIASRRPVTLGQTDRDHVIIESGLKSGDKIVVAGQHDLVAGEKVSIFE
ncbi:MAG: efflux RND transporter periplasmic adaptor subunit [Proteobacteria bacterium]|nr:efflux RND transporter periplasmic adaptor subunit [Pseudomonadota bacterium]